MPAYSSLAAALNQSSVRSLLDRLEELSAIRTIIQQTLTSCCPGINASAIYIDAADADASAGALVLTLGSAAEAAKLRQTLPQVTRALQRQGFHLNEIRLRVQPGVSGTGCFPSTTTPPRQAANTAGRQEALAFAERLARTAAGSSLGAAAVQLASALRHNVE